MTGVPIEPKGARRLSDCLIELQSIFTCMSVIEADRETQAFRSMNSLAPPTTEFHDHDSYVERWYLGDLAKSTFERALRSGHLKVVTDRDGQIVGPLNHQILFATNKCNMSVVLNAGVYRPMNIRPDRSDFGDNRRVATDDAVLWVMEDEWTRARTELVAERERQGSELAPGLAALLASTGAIGLGAAAESVAPARWSEERMTQEILASPFKNREECWLKDLKHKKTEHGWKNTAFRNHWSVAHRRKPGRPSGSI